MVQNRWWSNWGTCFHCDNLSVNSISVRWLVIFINCCTKSHGWQWLVHCLRNWQILKRLRMHVIENKNNCEKVNDADHILRARRIRCLRILKSINDLQFHCQHRALHICQQIVMKMNLHSLLWKWIYIHCWFTKTATWTIISGRSKLPGRKLKSVESVSKDGNPENICWPEEQISKRPNAGFLSLSLFPDSTWQTHEQCNCWLQPSSPFRVGLKSCGFKHKVRFRKIPR
jgi:hypothetical protein